MKKIESLTAEQEKQLIEHREKWLAIGLSTERADKKTSERIIHGFYSKINEDQPKVWFCDSPMQAQLIMNLFDQKDSNLWANLRANLRDNLGDNFGDNLGENYGDNVRAKLRANLS